MAWKQVTLDHYQNDNDRHVYWDESLQCLATETWADGAGMISIVIPIALLKKILSDHRFHVLRENEMKNMITTLERTTVQAQESYTLSEKNVILKQTNDSLKKLNKSAEEAFNNSLKVIEFDNTKITELLQSNKTLQASVQDILKRAQKEIDTLRARVKELESKQ